MMVTNIQERHVRALILVLFTAQCFSTGQSIVTTHKYTATVNFYHGNSDPPQKLGQTLSAFGIACASICSPYSASSFAIINLESTSFWCIADIPKRVCNKELKMGPLFFEKERSLPSMHNAEKEENLAPADRHDGNDRVKNITFVRTRYFEAHDRINKTLNWIKQEREVTSEISSWAVVSTMKNQNESTLKPNIRRQTSTKLVSRTMTGKMTGKEEKALEYFAVYGGAKSRLQMMHLNNDTLSQNCFKNMKRWMVHPVVKPTLGKNPMAIVRPTVLNFGGMVAICGGHAFDKKNETNNHPVQTCHSWQENSATMQSFANLSWPRYMGKSIVNEDGGSFAIIGGKGTTQRYSSHFDIYREGSFRLKRSTLPYMPEGCCIGSNKGMENVYLVTRAKNDGTTTFHQVNRNNYKSITLESPSKNVEKPYTCSIFRDKYMVISSIESKGLLLISQVFNIHIGKWTKIISNQKSPVSVKGKLPLKMHYLTYNETMKIIIFRGVKYMFLVDLDTYKPEPHVTGSILRTEISLQDARPVFVSYQMAESVC